MSEEKCIFCLIAKGEIPCAKVYEDDSVLAFLDLSPVHPGHTLVIPKEHYKDMLHVPCELGTAVFSALKKVGAAVMGATGASGFNVMQNNGLSAGQTMFHIHWHIIPRFDGDGLGVWEQGKYPDAAAMQDMAAKVASYLEK
ncbi:HIT family protein [Mailhella massiliensis]|uniref:HIT family protein n=1 Tax=Mailhella massiliensis TaxID=1903261 RepID=UPI00097D36E1|nr:HIT family protein [Mailhella massiliensis]